MKITNFAVFNAIEPLNKLVLLKLPIKVGFSLLKTIKKIDEINSLVTKKREEIVNTYASRNADGSVVKSKDAAGNDVENTVQIVNMVGFEKDMSDLMNFVNEVDVTPIKVVDVEHHVVELEVLAKLDWLFTE